MTTSVSFAYTINPGTLTITETGRVLNTDSPLGELRTRDPVAWAAISEFKSLGTTSGTVTISAV